MTPFYNIAMYALAAGVKAGAMRSGKIHEMARGHAEAFERLREFRAKHAPDGFDLWVHAASLGEFEQARPLLEDYRRRFPDRKVLLTFYSPSGYKVRHNYDRVDLVTYLPVDTPANAVRFIDLVKPRQVVFVKYEFWGNFLHGLCQRHIPVYLISSIFRPGQIFFSPFGGEMRGVLRCFRHIFVQNEESAKLLKGIGIDCVTVAGDTRLDRVHKVMTESRPVEPVADWLEKKGNPPFTLIVGSSWQPDEECYIPWLQRHPDVPVIIAPHEFDDHRLKVLQETLRVPSALWSKTVAEGKAIPPEAQALILDCFGLLSRIYRYGNAAIIGGGLGVGIHNINEAAVYGIPVAFGPNHAKFQEATDLLQMRTSPSDPIAAASEYCDASTASAILDTWLKNPAARQSAGKAAGSYIAANLGATDKIAAFLLADSEKLR